MKILILGGYGYTGRLLAKHLLQQSTAEIVLAARNIEKLQAYACQLTTLFGSERVSYVVINASDTASIHNALRGVNLLLVAAPTSKYAEIVARSALDCGTDYLDVQLSAHKLAFLKSLVPEIERKELCFITEAGFHPGLPAAMVRYAALNLDRIETAITACYLNMGKDIPFSDAVDELMEVLKNYQTQTFQHGNWTKSSGFELCRVNFGDDIGVQRCYPMFFEEMQKIPEMYPTLTDTGFYISGTHWFVDWVLTPLIMVGLKIAPVKSVRPAGKLLWWGMRTFSKPPFTVLLKVEATGTKSGKPAAFVATVSHKDGYELTAIPVVAALLQYIDGLGRKPGLWMMGHLVEPVRLFSDMEKMGVRIESSFNYH